MGVLERVGAWEGAWLLTFGIAAAWRAARCARFLFDALPLFGWNHEEARCPWCRWLSHREWHAMFLALNGLQFTCLWQGGSAELAPSLFGVLGALIVLPGPASEAVRRTGHALAAPGPANAGRYGISILLAGFANGCAALRVLETGPGGQVPGAPLGAWFSFGALGFVCWLGWAFFWRGWKRGDFGFLVHEERVRLWWFGGPLAALCLLYGLI